ncbi:MAG: glycosyltransferase [Candidatus Gracilibacteria bacterium]|jgi:1,2-diacylglycerol 3-alpha-glucosyltransferase
MNILFTSDHYLPTVNGIVHQMVIIKQELEKRGHKVIVVAPKCDNYDKVEKNVIYVPSVPFFMRPQDRLSAPFNKEIDNILDNLEIDIVHSHSILIGSFIGTKTAKKKKIPNVFTLHTPFQEYTKWLFPWLAGITPPITNLILQMSLKPFDLVIAPSKKAVRHLKRAKVKAPISMIHNGIELEKIKQIPAHLFLKKYKLNPDDPLLVLVGRIDRGKNVHLAIKAMKKVIQKFPKTKLMIIGDGLQRESMDRLIKRLKLGNNVFITGFIEHDLVISANKAATLALMTSDSDTLPTVAIEAIACGKSMVAVNDEAITAIIKNGMNGILTKKKAPEIATAIIKLLKTSHIRKGYEKNSLQIAPNFSVEKYVDELEKVYSELIHKKSSYGSKKKSEKDRE